MTMAWIGVGVAAVGVVGGIVESNAASNAASAAASNQAYQDQVTKAESEIRAETNLTEQEKANRATEGEQRLAEAGSGFDVSAGSPLDAQFAQFATDQFKDQVAVFNGLVNASADQAAAINAENQGSIAVANIHAQEFQSTASGMAAAATAAYTAMHG
ncbi:MAG: hypothetical protein ACYDB1_01215 [Acidiferrobacteraceae bacterium]